MFAPAVGEQQITKKKRMAPGAAAGAGGGAAGTPAGGAAAAATVDEGWERVGERGDKGGGERHECNGRGSAL